MPLYVSLSALKEVAAASGVQAVSVLGGVGGYRVAVRYGGQVRELSSRTRKGEVRAKTFRSFETASRYLRGVGLVRYEVDVSQFQPSTVKRPDRAAAMKQAHEAAAYDRYVRERVRIGQEALAAADTVPHEEVMRKAREKIDAHRRSRIPAA